MHTIFLVLMRVSTRFLTRGEIGRGENEENVDFVAYTEVCLLNQSSNAADSCDDIMLPSRSIGDSAHRRQAPVICQDIYSSNCLAIRTSSHKDNDEVFYPLSVRNSDLPARSRQPREEANSSKFNSSSQSIKRNTYMHSVTEDLAVFINGKESYTLKNERMGERVMSCLLYFRNYQNNLETNL